ncbi:protein SCAI [Polychytrium aggregatum]|uniref:protein SCAI n=1 Tax=Polychytrium aggregatum TaxID=110093 RepID=UPI0022FE05FA|nr:protein SCAI [Polychytrium aggregatum]KAI9208764.1 protein SCAI [Polychytrium aggregatum]
MDIPHLDADLAQPVQPSSNKIVEEFQYLLEKSQQLFAGLRDLPPTGRNWQPYFQRTFEVYTKLWKFQQQHRAVLESSESYGLKRWEIGEIASKIGQLYYHYYLRTSETNYLLESFIFYDAIRERQYFRDVMETKNTGLVIKKLRYFARFIVVCLLLNKNAVINKLMDELTLLVDDYTKSFKPNDTAEWSVVLSEITTFLEAEKKLSPVDFEGNVLSVTNRLQLERTLRVDKDGQPKLKLQEAILVGNYQNQIKFSELTLDMYRILQSLEREPATSLIGVQRTMGADVVVKSEETNANDDGGDRTSDKSATRRTNPHKYLLYRPTISQLLLYIATAFKDISDNSAMLLYISANGCKRSAKPEQTDSSYTGGVATAVNYARKGNEKSESDQTSLVHCLHPHDLVPFTRKPLFLIIDSTNSTAFKNFPKVFNQNLMCLLSPTEYPTTIKDTTLIGSLFTLFLHSPVKAFVFISDTNEISTNTWQKCVAHMTSIEREISDLLDANQNLDKSVKRFMQDDFLRQLIIRFVLCDAILHCHNAFKESKHLPASYPALPPSFSSAPEIVNKIQELVNMAEVTSFYTFNSAAPAAAQAPANSSSGTATPGAAPGTSTAPAPSSGNEEAVSATPAEEAA